MAGMRDPLTEDPPPSRFDPEELNSFQPTDGVDLAPPSIVWASSLTERLQSAKLKPQLLLLALSKLGIDLIHNLPGKTVIGRILLAGSSLPKASPDPSPRDSTCYIFSCNSDLTILFISVQYPVPAESSNVWTKFLFQCFQPERLLVLEHTPIRHFRGKLSVDEPTLFLLSTDKQKVEDKTLKQVPAYYPSGSLVDGLAAALLTHCQIRELKARMILTWPTSDSRLVKMLVSTLSAILDALPQAVSVNFVEAGKRLGAQRPMPKNDLYI